MNQEQYISGGHDNGRDFFQYQGELSKRFYFTPGDYWGEHNAMQEAADYRDEVIAARSAIAGRPLTPREAAFGITRRDDRDFETKRVAQLELQQFKLSNPFRFKIAVVAASNSKRRFSWRKRPARNGRTRRNYFVAGIGGFLHCVVFTPVVARREGKSLAQLALVLEKVAAV